ncbi:hypothetical protein [Methylovulum psychrotolerans]|uniref:Uncharacterized protein n=1 Tax=Methylovulum psychrotolerans TaxID=1704499 RepID=A0A2S5CR59_9GAMM|nr:hypothetical protein [Methylovulum psychrotolerans]POZ53293.1 hypothetical protein AADEFJLK_00312 [Methylovulum psychrotolerans]
MTNQNIIYITGIIALALVVIIAIWRTRLVDFTLNKKGTRLKANKDSEKDTVSVTKITQSAVEIENRKGQDVRVEDVSDTSNVKIK